MAKKVKNKNKRSTGVTSMTKVRKSKTNPCAARPFGGGVPGTRNSAGKVIGNKAVHSLSHPKPASSPLSSIRSGRVSSGAKINVRANPVSVRSSGPARGYSGGVRRPFGGSKKYFVIKDFFTND